MKLWPSSLSGRLIATSVILVTVVSLLVGISATIVMRSYLMGRLDEQLSDSVRRAQGGFEGSIGGPGGTPTNSLTVCGSPLNPPRGQRDRTVTAIFGESCRGGVQITTGGRLLELSSSALDTLADVTPTTSSQDLRASTVSLPALGSFRVAATTSDDGTTIVQGIPTEDVDQTVASLIWWEVLLSLAGIAIASFVARQLVRRQLRPLREVAATANEVAAMPLTTGEVGTTARVPEELADPGTEVGQVAHAMNQMLGHVERALDARHESEQQVRQFLADASHELRTPLATIKGYAELTRRTGADATQSLTKVESEAARMSTLVEDMLVLARLDAGRGVETRPVDLTPLVVEALNDARVVDPERNWRLSVPDEPVEIDGDEIRLHQAVTNLLTNASRHTPEGTTVTARVLVDPIRVEVSDDGPGIAPTLLPTIFDRFSRGDSSRTRASGGAGLGMSLVKAIMAAHGGSASVTSEPGATTFTLTFGRTGNAQRT